MVSSLEGGAITRTRGRIGDVHLCVVISKVPMACENLGEAGGEFTLGGLEVGGSFLLGSQDGPSEVEAGGTRNRKVLVFQLPSLVPISFDLFLDFRLRGEVKDRIRAGP